MLVVLKVDPLVALMAGLMVVPMAWWMAEHLDNSMAGQMVEKMGELKVVSMVALTVMLWAVEKGGL
jgi:hypothetical protein